MTARHRLVIRVSVCLLFLPAAVPQFSGLLQQNTAFLDLLVEKPPTGVNIFAHYNAAAGKVPDARGDDYDITVTSSEVERGMPRGDVVEGDTGLSASMTIPDDSYGRGTYELRYSSNVAESSARTAKNLLQPDGYSSSFPTVAFSSVGYSLEGTYEGDESVDGVHDGEFFKVKFPGCYAMRGSKLLGHDDGNGDWSGLPATYRIYGRMHDDDDWVVLLAVGTQRTANENVAVDLANAVCYMQYAICVHTVRGGRGQLALHAWQITGLFEVPHVEATPAGSSNAANEVTTLYGSRGTQLTWPRKLAATFTVCWATRYHSATSRNERILECVEPDNCFFSHKAGQTGYMRMTDYYSEGEGEKDDVDDTESSLYWAIACFNGLPGPVNYVIDQTNKGNTLAPTHDAGFTLGVNNGVNADHIGDFNIHSVYVWDQQLTNAEMKTVTRGLRKEIGGVPYAGRTVADHAGKPAVFPISDLRAYNLRVLIALRPPQSINIFADLEGTTVRDRVGVTDAGDFPVTVEAGTASLVTPLTLSSNGAGNTITVLGGTTATQLLWPIDSVPQIFTICSVSRYTSDGDSRRRILTTQETNWLHGHYNSNRGVAYYSDWKTVDTASVGATNSDWLVMCGTSGGVAPGNVIIDQLEVGTSVGGNDAASRMNVNMRSQNSAFELHSVYIWNAVLTTVQMKVVSSALRAQIGGGPDIADDAKGPAVAAMAPAPTAYEQLCPGGYVTPSSGDCITCERGSFWGEPATAPNTALSIPHDASEIVGDHLLYAPACTGGESTSCYNRTACAAAVTVPTGTSIPDECWATSDDTDIASGGGGGGFALFDFFCMEPTEVKVEVYARGLDGNGDSLWLQVDEELSDENKWQHVQLDRLADGWREPSRAASPLSRGRHTLRISVRERSSRMSHVRFLEGAGSCYFSKDADPRTAVCTLCAEGMTTFAGGASEAGQCESECALGEYRDTESGACKQCAAGYALSSDGNTCPPCAAGTYKEKPGNWACKQCDGYMTSEVGSTHADACAVLESTGLRTAGDGNVISGQCIGCAMGYYMTRNDTTRAETGDDAATQYTGLYCRACTPGTFSRDNTSITCDQCPRGHFQQSAAAPSCEPCDVGYIAAEEGNVLCTPCGKGFSANATGRSECTICAAGTYAAKYGSENCSACALGTYSLQGAAQCIRCPGGTFGDVNATTATCTPCPNVEYTSRATGITHQHLQTSGVLGARSLEEARCLPLNSVIASCNDSAVARCAEDQFLSGCGGVYPGVCVNCSAICPTLTVSYGCGRRNPGCCALEGQGNCTIPQPLPSGEPPELLLDYDRMVWLLVKNLCPPGTYESTSASAGPRSCLPCETGFFKDTWGTPDDLACSPCPRGTFGPERGANRSEQCSVCPPGSFGLTTHPEGQYAEGTACYSCPAGSVAATPATGENATVRDFETACDQCAMGSHGGTAGVCTPCTGGGTTESAGTKSADKCFCAEGSTFDRVAQLCLNLTVTECGEMQVQASRWSECLFCRPYNVPSSSGSTCVRLMDDDIASAPLRPCWRHAVTRHTKNDDGSWVLDCVDCPAVDPDNAAAGLMFAGRDAMVADSQCAPGCRPGTFFTPNATAQPAAPTGVNGSLVHWNCTVCPAGTVAATVNELQCTPCEPGSYSVVSTEATVCLQTRPGTAQPRSGATSFDVCPAGTWSPANASTCQVCAAGTYSGPSAAQCTACEIPRVALEEGSASCAPCPWGTQRENASVCELCPLGKKATESADTTGCVECPVDTFGVGASDGRNTCRACANGSSTFGETGAAQRVPGESPCGICSDGYEQIQDSCQICPAGSNSTQRPGRTECTQCAAGSVARESGSAGCAACQAGQVSNWWNTQCLLCGKVYGDVRGVAQDNMCVCPPDMVRTAKGSIACSRCEEGSSTNGVAGASRCEAPPTTTTTPTPTTPATTTPTPAEPTTTTTTAPVVATTTTTTNSAVDSTTATPPPAAETTTPMPGVEPSTTPDPSDPAPRRQAAVKLSIELQLTMGEYFAVADDITRSVAAVANVEVSRVTVEGVQPRAAARRRLLSGTLEVRFSIQPPEEAPGVATSEAIAMTLSQTSLQAEMEQTPALSPIASTLVVLRVTVQPLLPPPREQAPVRLSIVMQITMQEYFQVAAYLAQAIASVAQVGVRRVEEVGAQEDEQPGLTTSSLTLDFVIRPPDEGPGVATSADIASALSSSSIQGALVPLDESMPYFSETLVVVSVVVGSPPQGPQDATEPWLLYGAIAGGGLLLCVILTVACVCVSRQRNKQRQGSAAPMRKPGAYPAAHQYQPLQLHGANVALEYAVPGFGYKHADWPAQMPAMPQHANQAWAVGVQQPLQQPHQQQQRWTPYANNAPPFQPDMFYSPPPCYAQSDNYFRYHTKST